MTAAQHAVRYCPACATPLALRSEVEDGGPKERMRCPACGWTHWNNPVPVLAAVVECAEALRARGRACPVVSVGSTPTATFAASFRGVSEVRTGVYMFQDLVMAGLGVCGVDDIALSVLGSVIGHQRGKNWVVTDAGWMALSRDRGTARQKVDQGYGVVCGADGKPIEDLVVIEANQEHGIVARRGGGAIDFARFPIGSLLRVLPNHACATAAQHGEYHLLRDNDPIDVWERFNGW